MRVSSVTNAFRLLVRSGQMALEIATLSGYERSQTPFGCWSDQDGTNMSKITTLKGEVTNAFRLLVRSGLDNLGLAEAVRLLEGHKRLSAVGPIRTLCVGKEYVGTEPEGHKRLSAVGPFRTLVGDGYTVTRHCVTNAFRLLVRLGLRRLAIPVR